MSMVSQEWLQQNGKWGPNGQSYADWLRSPNLAPKAPLPQTLPDGSQRQPGDPNIYGMTPNGMIGTQMGWGPQLTDVMNRLGFGGGMQNPKFAGPGSSAMGQMPNGGWVGALQGGMQGMGMRPANPGMGQMRNDERLAYDQAKRGPVMQTPERAAHQADYAARHPIHAGVPTAGVQRPGAPREVINPVDPGGIDPSTNQPVGSTPVDPGGVDPVSGQIIRNPAHAARLKAAQHQKDYAARNPQHAGMMIPKVPTATIRR